MENKTPVRYIGKRNEKHDPVTGAHFFWPKRGSVLNIPSPLAVKLLSIPSVWVVAGSKEDPLKEVGPEGLDPTEGEGVPMTAEETIVSLAIRIMDLDGAETALAVFNGEFVSKQDQMDAGQDNSLGNDTIDAVNAAFQVMIDNNPERDDVEVFDATKKPKIKAVELTTGGIKITADERDDYWEAFIKEVDG